jgi:hypothetical protein
VEQRIEEMKNDLHADGFCTKAFFATEAAELQSALALPSAGDAAEQIPQTLDDESGGVRGRGDLGAKKTGGSGEVFRELGRTQEAHPSDRRGLEKR